MTAQISKSEQDERGLLPYPVIIAATKGDPEAMNIVVQHYESYIASLSMLNQASDDRSILAQRLNISPHQLSYVTNSGEGEGLLFYGNVILPFIDRFPTDLELYRIMTTKLNEVAQEKEA